VVSAFSIPAEMTTAGVKAKVVEDMIFFWGFWGFWKEIQSVGILVLGFWFLVFGLRALEAV